MNLIARHINYLLCHNQCVVVPGFGAFVTNDRHACIDGASFIPPCREISFNSSITHDDGLLVNSVARSLQVSYSLAYEKVSYDVKALERQLSSDGEIAFPNIGVLRKSNDLIEFEPFMVNVASLPYTSLPTLKLTPVREQARIDINITPEKTHAKRNIRYWSNIAASLIVLICLGILFSTPIHIQDSQLASFSLLDVTIPESEDIDESFPAMQYEPQVLNIAIPVQTPANSSKDNIMVSEKAQISHSYYIIVASLPTMQLAKRFINETPDSDNLQILHCDSKFRVYVAEASSITEALTMKSEQAISSRFSDAWVLKN